MTATVTRPVLRYHGGKWVIAPWIISHFPEHNTYVELFGGAASVLLRKPRSANEIYNELDGDVVSLFRCLRNPADTAKLCNLLELTPFSRRDFIEAHERSDDPVEAARRLVIRSMFGFQATGNRAYITGFRAASKQSGRPHALDWANVPECLHAVTERMKGVVIENKDALKLIGQHDAADTLFYADPPYMLDLRNTNDGCYKFNMDGFEHDCLLRLLRQIKGKVVISGYASDLYDDKLKDWRRFERSHLKGSNSGSVESNEIIWMNF